MNVAFAPLDSRCYGYCTPASTLAIIAHPSILTGSGTSASDVCGLGYGLPDQEGAPTH